MRGGVREQALRLCARLTDLHVRGTFPLTCQPGRQGASCASSRNPTGRLPCEDLGLLRCDLFLKLRKGPGDARSRHESRPRVGSRAHQMPWCTSCALRRPAAIRARRIGVSTRSVIRARRIEVSMSLICAVMNLCGEFLVRGTMPHGADHALWRRERVCCGAGARGGGGDNPPGLPSLCWPSLAGASSP